MTLGSLKDFLKLAIVPLVLLLIILSVLLVYKISGIHPRDSVTQIAEKYFEKYGLWVVFFGALAEGLLFLNWYLPGSVIIVFSVVLAGRDLGNVTLVVSLVIIAFFITSILNYLLGKHGWYHLFMKFGLKEPLERIKRRVEKHGLSIIFGTYLHPNIGALTATSAGILKLPFRKFLFYSMAALLFWNSLWGIVVYLIGPLILEYWGLWFVTTVMIVWLIILAVKFIRGRKKSIVQVP